ncbi:MAG: response regulator [Thermoanaerobaculia bacterium]
MLLAQEVILIVDDDPEVTEGLALALAEPARLIITCNDVESAQVVLERTTVRTMVTDVRFSGPFGFEGLDVVRHAIEKAPGIQIILMSGNATPELESEAFRRGAQAFLQKPFGLEQLEELLLQEAS